MNYDDMRDGPPFNQGYLRTIDGWTQCPACGGEHLHQGETTVFEYTPGRDGTLMRTRVKGGMVFNHVVLSDDPGVRPVDDGVVIEFWCEDCHATPELTITQHKGSTLIAWGVLSLDQLRKYHDQAEGGTTEPTRVGGSES